MGQDTIKLRIDRIPEMLPPAKPAKNCLTNSRALVFFRESPYNLSGIVDVKRVAGLGGPYA